MTPSRPKFLYIKKFREFQHYHTRGAPWIKLYASLLEDPEFLSLNEAAQAQLMKVWLLASQFGHPLPNNPKLIAGKIGTTGRFHLQAMIDAGFLIPGNEDASANASNIASEHASTDASKSASTNGAEPLRDASDTTRTDARVPERREVRGESSEKRTTPPPPRDAAFERVAAKLASDTDRAQFLKIVNAAEVGASFVAELDASLTGMAGHKHVTAEQAGSAIRDFVANGKIKGPQPPRLITFRRYLDLAATLDDRPSTPASARSGEKPDWQLSEREKLERAAAVVQAEDDARKAAAGGTR